MNPLPDYAVMEVERYLSDARFSGRALLNLGRRFGVDLEDATAPDDAAEVAATLQPWDAEDTIYRGSIEFPISVTCLGRTHRRQCRVVYATTLGSDENIHTGEPIRTIDNMVSIVQVLVWDEAGGQFVWQNLDDRLLPVAAIWLLDAKISEQAAAQESAELKI